MDIQTAFGRLKFMADVSPSMDDKTAMAIVELYTTNRDQRINKALAVLKASENDREVDTARLCEIVRNILRTGGA